MIHCFIDLETTGTDPERHAIIQIAGLVQEDGKHRLTFDFEVRPLPNKLIEPEALEINGKMEDEIYQYPEAEKVHKQLLKQFGGLVDKYRPKDKMFFVGYRSDFDYQFLRQWFLDLGDDYFGSWFFAPPMDVMQLAIFKLQKRRDLMENFKQATVARELGITVEDAALHDAMYDVRLTMAIWKALEELDGKEANIGAALKS
jgi:DNA polymerase-3 subunit epsilon